MAAKGNARSFGQKVAGSPAARSTGGQQQAGRTSLTHGTKGQTDNGPRNTAALTKGGESTVNSQPVSSKQRQ